MLGHFLGTIKQIVIYFHEPNEADRDRCFGAGRITLWEQNVRHEMPETSFRNIQRRSTPEFIVFKQENK